MRLNGDAVVVDGRNAALVTLRQERVVDQLDLSGMTHHLNDMVIDRHGRIYVGAFQSDPFDNGWKADGQILLVRPGEAPRVVADGILGPNGIAISPGGDTLVVGESMGPAGTPTGARLIGYTIGDDGSLSDERVVATIERGSGDGLCFDSEGGIWVGCSFGHEVQRFVDGAVVQRIRLAANRWALACALGGADLTTMYICSVPPPPKGQPSLMTDGWIETVQVGVPGFTS